MQLHVLTVWEKVLLMVLCGCRLKALKEKIAEQKKHLDTLDANVYVDPSVRA